MKRPISSLLAVLLFLGSAGVQAGGAVEASARALEHAMQALGYSLETGFKLAFGAAAVPLTVAGGIGEVSKQAGEDFWRFANEPPSGPLPVSDEVITAGPHPGDQGREPQPRAAAPEQDPAPAEALQ